MRELVVTGDVFRPFDVGERWESATWKNIRWLDGIVGTAARLAGFEVRSVAWDEALPLGRGFVDTPALYAALGLPVSTRSWAELITRPALPESVEAMLRDLYAGADLVVGYELPDHLLRILGAAGVAVIDVILHPVRFLDDAVFALRTNRADIHARLLRHALPADLPVLQAGLIRSKAAWMTPPLPLRPGAALVLGQVAEDRAAVDPATGRFVGLADHADTILDLAVRSSMLLFKPHPYDRPGSAAQRMMRRLGAVQWTDANVYHLLAQPEIETVCAVNSSALVEAELFGKRVVRLAPSLYRFGDAAPVDGGYGEAVPQDGAWCEPDFWRAQRSGNEGAGRLLPQRANRLRRSLNADWGFSSIDRVVA